MKQFTKLNVECQAVNIGEKSKIVGDRMKEHQGCIRRSYENSWIYYNMD